MSEHRGTERTITFAFLVAALGGVGFAVSYALGGQTQLEGVALAVAFGGVAIGLGAWAKRLLPSGSHVEEHEGFSSTPRQQSEVSTRIIDVARPRRKVLVRSLLLALGAIGAALLFPVRSLLPTRGPSPGEVLARTPWRDGGVRLIDHRGLPVRADDVTSDNIVIVRPENHPDAGNAPAFVVRLDPAQLTVPPPAQHVGGVIAYSLLCTHSGCAVALYEKGNAQLLCPCHQSVFDLFDGARPVAGPASRPLPGLPITVDNAGYLRATGDFSAPPGPGYWSMP